VFDVGLPELLVIALVGLVVFGPDRLPSAITTATTWLRQLRDMAAQTRQELTDSLGTSVDDSGLTDAMKDIRDLHPRRIVSGLLDEAPKNSKGSATGPPRNGHGATPPGAATGGTATTYDPDAT